MRSPPIEPTDLSPVAGAPRLEPNKAPAQKRAQQTYESILQATAELLAEVGVERLSTNLVCKRADVSPPALYRYFPNKYALLHELGVRLMSAQNVLIERHLTPEVLLNPADALHPALVQLFMATHQLTLDTTAGVWITRALRAVPTLQGVRIQSHQAVTAEIQQGLTFLYPDTNPEQLRITVRLSVELMYAAIEMLFDDPQLDRQQAADTTAWVVHDMFARIGLVTPRA
jgi:AcrR family transcriptional regulator